MYNANIPSDQEVPSTKKLIKSTILAALVAGVILITVVMPAEYGIDPTGIGNAIGLKEMGDIKASLAKEAAEDQAKELAAQDQPITLLADASIIDPEKTTGSNSLSHQMKVELLPDEGTEIKVAMSKGSTVQYEWWTDGGEAKFDVHGDAKELKIDYHNYSKGSEQKMEGSIEAAFDGSHGWFWRNRTAETMTITLSTNGEYTDIKHMK